MLSIPQQYHTPSPLPWQGGKPNIYLLFIFPPIQKPGQAPPRGKRPPRPDVKEKRSHDPRRSRGLGLALEGHNTDNAPQGATNGSANCIADSWRPLKGLFLCLGILATRKRVCELLQAHLVCYLIFCQLLLDVLLYLLFIPSDRVYIVSRLSPYLYFKFACRSNIIKLLFPLRYPMICDTLYLGGILTSM